LKKDGRESFAKSWSARIHRTRKNWARCFEGDI
jgi:hypothetical protein